MTASTLTDLRARLAELCDLRAVANLVEWDQFVMMPPGGAAARAHQSGTLSAVRHRLATDPELGRLLDEAERTVAGLPEDALDAAVVRAARHDYDRAVRVPAELASELAVVSSQSAEAWAAARADDDFEAFRPWLDRVLELRRRYADCFPESAPYDALLHDYEPGLRAELVEEIFARLEPELTELTRTAAADEAEPFEAGPYDPDAQHRVSLEIARAFGADERFFRLDPTVHPFCLSVGIDDVRLTTRYMDELADHSLFSTMHEVGHGLYEHGIDRALDRTPLATGLSMALHESQSRLWENVIGRSRPFWAWFYPRLQAAHPELLGSVSRERFVRAVNAVRPSYVRVAADEVTYGLHIILRFELEQRLLSGELATSELPEAWNARFEELLGLRPPSDRLGCLQDVHWAAGLIGYFPTYQLGNVLSVQIWERLQEDVPDTDEQIAAGRFDAVHAWLRDRLYRLGRTYPLAETLERVVGGPIDPAPYLGYLRRKVAEAAAA